MEKALAEVAAALPPLFRDCELVDGPKLPDTFWLAEGYHQTGATRYRE